VSKFRIEYRTVNCHKGPQDTGGLVTHEQYEVCTEDDCIAIFFNAKLAQEYVALRADNDRLLAPAEVFPLWTYIKEEVEVRKWSINMLCRASGLTIFIIEAISRREPITPEIAAALGRAFGTCAERWLNFDRRWQKRKQALAQAEGEAP